MKQSRKHPLFDWNYLPMDAARLICAPLLLWYRMKKLTPTGQKYTDHIQGGAVLAVNHTSFSDPFLVGVTVWYRRLYFLAAEAVMQGKLRTWLLKGVGAIRIDRNCADIEAIRNCVNVLKKGHLIAIFPQGGITHDDQITAIKSGAVLIALQAGVPIIPMHIFPKKHFFSRRVTVIGNPIDPKQYIQSKFPSTKDIESVSQILMEEMNSCMIYQ